jgi:hypothetical protein
MKQERAASRRQVVAGLFVAGLLLVVVGAVLGALSGAPAVAGVAAGGVAAALVVLLGFARVEAPIPIGTARLLAAQPVVLAAFATGTAVAVGSPDGVAARLAGGALAAIAVALDCLVVAFWFQDRQNRS